MIRTLLGGPFESTPAPFGTAAYTTPSVTPPANSLLAVVVAYETNNTSTVPVINLTDSAGHAWTRAIQRLGDTAATAYGQSVAIFVAPNVATTAFTLTAQAAVSTAMYSWKVVPLAYTGYNRGTPTGATASAVGWSPATTFSLTMSGAPLVGSELLGVFVSDDDANGANLTPTGTQVAETGPSPVVNVQASAPTGGAVPNTTITWTPPGVTGFVMCAVALEIRATEVRNQRTKVYVAYKPTANSTAIRFEAKGRANAHTRAQRQKLYVAGQKVFHQTFMYFTPTATAAAMQRLERTKLYVAGRQTGPTVAGGTASMQFVALATAAGGPAVGAALASIRFRPVASGIVVSPPPILPPLGPPSFEELINADSVKVYRRVDIYEQDAVTPYKLNVPVIDGSISVDYTRDERRTADLTLDNTDDSLSLAPNKLWYDKVIKVYRGLISDFAPNDPYVAQIGEFTIDQIVMPHFPDQVQVSARDYTKRMLLARFASATTFAAATRIDDALKGIATGAGITRWNIPIIATPLGKDFAYERGTDRWKAFTDITTWFGYESFFSPNGTLTVRAFVDPLTAALSYRFLTGGEGNLASYTRTSNDTDIRNHIVVQGSTNTQNPVWGQAENNEPSSPTRISELGRRTEVYTSALVSTDAQAAQLAAAWLKVSALENYQIEMDAVVVPFLEAGTAVEFIPARHVQPGDPTRFLLVSFVIPMPLGTMQATAKRITIVG